MPEFPVLTTARLTLRQLRASDRDAVFAFRSDPVAQRFNSKPMQTAAQALDLMMVLAASFEAGECIAWGLAGHGDDRVIGLVTVSSINPDHRRAELGYDLHRPLWGTGLAREAVASVLRYSFEELALHRLEARTVADNDRSVRLLDALGFRREALLRECSLEDDGKFHDAIISAMLASEYTA